MQDGSALARALEWAYDRALTGLPGAASARQMGDEYLRAEGTLTERVDRLIRFQVYKSSAAGFVSGLAGAGAFPVAVPAALTTVVYVQLRMVAAIAHMGGHDVESDRVRTLVYACLCGNAAKEVVKDAGVVIGTRLTRDALVVASGRLLSKAGGTAGATLLSRAAASSATHLARMVPLVGGGIGAAFDGAATYAAGRAARQLFLA